MWNVLPIILLQYFPLHKNEENYFLVVLIQLGSQKKFKKKKELKKKKRKMKGQQTKIAYGNYLQLWNVALLNISA